MNNFVYIITSDKYCKVGITNDPYRRLKDISTGCPIKPSLYFFKRVENAKLIESRTHNVLKQYKTNGEWFEISPEECKETLEYIIKNWSK